MRLPLTPQLRFSRQIDAVSTRKNVFKISSGITNGMVEVGETPFLVNRPTFKTEDDASAVSAGDIGRGIYFWRAAGQLYTVVDTVVYWGDTLENPTTGATLTSNTQKVYMFEVGSNLVIIDPKGNKGYYITAAADTVVVEITDVDFPPKQTPALQLAQGGDGYKGRAYVMDTDGTIWNSASEDPTSWSGGDNINAEMKTDGGVHLEKYRNELIAFGEESVEYFYHAGNPTNSPLSVRQDVFHDIGCYGFDTITKVNDSVYFVGQDKGAGVGVYRLTGHELSKISTPDMDAYLTSICADSEGFILRLMGGGFNAQGRAFYLLSIDIFTAIETYAYDDLTKLWYKWDYDEESIEGVPVVDTTFAVLPGKTTTISRMVIANGDVISTDGKYRQVSLPADSNKPVSLQILTGNQRFESNKIKFMSNVSLDAFVTHADTEQSSQTARLRFYDEGEIDSTGLPTHDIEILDRHLGSAGNSNVLARAGSFRQRNIEITIPTDASVTRTEIHALDFDIRKGL